MPKIKMKLLDEKVLIDLKNNIENILDNGGKLEVDTIYPDIIFDIFDELGVKDARENFDFNGWEFDWYSNFSCGGKTFCLSGGGYYGNFTFESR